VITVRPATESDLLTFFGTMPPELEITRVLAWVGEEDGKIVGIGGVRYHADGGVTGFVNATPDCRAHPVVMHRTALRFLAHWREAGHRTLRATIDSRIPRADVWARRLGFVPLDDEGGVWAWRSDA
jgi:hypothetical protein